MLKTVSILCPVYNESENVEDFFLEFNKCTLPYRDRYQFNYIFVDNNSEDDTCEKIKSLGLINKNITLIKYSRNFGYMKSIYTGFINSPDDACVIFDCDLQDPPSLLLDFLHYWEGGFKVVYGKRITRVESSLFSAFRKAYRRIENSIKGYQVQLETGSWFLDRCVIEELKKTKFDPYLPGLITRLGFKSKGVPYDRGIRKRGTSKVNYPHYFSYARDGLVSGNITPLRLASIFGFLFSATSFLLVFYIVIAKLYLGAPFASGVAFTITIVLFSFGINFLILGVIGEYIGRIYLERELTQPAIIEEIYRSQD
ncbi:glycosyltransferase [Polynucleobacter sp. MG-27-Goln-C1]|uniref:glycosyltransferase n=1 Tax=Polynucleobacter sp. MG-27-Goln-C1 TaxID=1819726 RepID=UPI001C0D41F4|nr:glycosyltransferase [Polynucleobacter sp. MG-27-Goln-C1]